MPARAETSEHGWALPLRLALASSAAAAISVVWIISSSPGPSGAELRRRALTQTPERVAEGFIEAYDAGDYTRAATLASEPLQSRVRTRSEARPHLSTRHGRKARNLVIEESYFLPQGKQRLLGVLTEESAPEASGWPVALVVARHEEHFLVDELIWPKGPPPERP